MIRPDCADGEPCRCDRLKATLERLREEDLALPPSTAPTVAPTDGTTSMGVYAAVPESIRRRMLRFVATHESGHVALATVLYGGGPGRAASVTIAADGLGRALTTLDTAGFADLSREALPRAMVRRIGVSLAGHHAAPGHAVYDEDRKLATRLAHHLVPRCNAETLLRVIDDATRVAVHDALPAIERLAAALAQRITLDGDEARAIVADVSWLTWLHGAAFDAIADSIQPKEGTDVAA
jgi:hypothetical protein